jgi:hypothetical protein
MINNGSANNDEDVREEYWLKQCDRLGIDPMMEPDRSIWELAWNQCLDIYRDFKR